MYFNLHLVILGLIIFYINIVDGQISENKGPSCEDFKDIHLYKPEDIKNPCWMQADSDKLFSTLEDLEDKYSRDRLIFHKAAQKAEYDKNILLQPWLHKHIAELLTTTGTKPRESTRREIKRGSGVVIGEFYNNGGQLGRIPLPLNMEGYSLFRIKDGLLIFHRMKLRNNTHFTMRKLSNDVQNLVFDSTMTSNIVHLVGEYDRLITDGNTSNILYRPVHGTIEIILRFVSYNQKGSLRLISNKAMMIEHVVSNLYAEQYELIINGKKGLFKGRRFDINRENVDTFIQKLQKDLDNWFKEYLNGFLFRVSNSLMPASPRMQEFDKAKQYFLNDYVDSMIKMLNTRLDTRNFKTIRIPRFRIRTLDRKRIVLYEGRVMGLNEMYRRSVATVSAPGEARFVVADIGFHAKVVYKVRIIIARNPWIYGELQFNSDDIKAQMHLGFMKDDGFVEMYINSIELSKVEFLTMDGPINMHIKNFKHLFEHEIVALTTYGIIHSILALNTLVWCDPNVASIGTEAKTKK